MNKAELIIYNAPENSDFQIEVRIENDTVWLNRQQIAVLFNRDIKTIGKHINNALKEELSDILVIAKFATTATDGKIYQVDYYNLDVIISVGYRVKSKRGTQFRIWATQIIKDFLLKGYAINNRVNRLEEKLIYHDRKFELLLNTNLQPNEGIFYDGQVFDVQRV